MKKYVVEFIGTFFLVLTVCMAGSELRPLAIGCALMIMVYAGGHISGGHYNPAVTLGVWLRGKCDTKDVVPYWIAQFAAALVAVLATGLLKGASVFNFASGGDVAWLPCILAELLGTFALVWVVLNSATAKGTAGNSFYGLAIGFTVFVCAVALGPISGGAFNPAVGLGVFATGAGLSKFIVYVVADFVGGAIAAFTYKFVNGSE